MTSFVAMRRMSIRQIVFAGAGAGAGQPLARFGHMIAFYLHTVLAIPVALRRYRREFMRLLSDITWGNGSIVVGGGTVGVVLVLGITAGALVAIEGYNFLNMMGIGPATGVVSSLVTTRELAPIMAALGFAVQAGCRFTTQIGAMRVAEEIDALNAMAIRPIPYLVTTRLLAFAVAIIPLYIACLTISYLSCQLMVTFTTHGSVGPYLHYFTMLIDARDVGYSVIKAAVFVALASVVQCYYGFCAEGGPEGVGVAAGHAMRASITVVIIVNMVLTMALWSVDAGVRFGG